MIRALVLAGVMLAVAGCSDDSGLAWEDTRASYETNRAYQHYCGGCHGAPRPGLHTAREWPNIVARMQQRRMSARLGPIPNDELRQILDYLQANAADSAPQ